MTRTAAYIHLYSCLRLFFFLRTVQNRFYFFFVNDELMKERRSIQSNQSIDIIMYILFMKLFFLKKIDLLSFRLLLLFSSNSLIESQRRIFYFSINWYIPKKKKIKRHSKLF